MLHIKKGAMTTNVFLKNKDSIKWQNERLDMGDYTHQYEILKATDVEYYLTPDCTGGSSIGTVYRTDKACESYPFEWFFNLDCHCEGIDKDPTVILTYP
tara:strand:- start:1344 stop:1640 length:297 start_codon:yes stop_codon:yes gene_type:complete